MEKSPTPFAGIANRDVAHARGFTLIELMITVAIVAILSAIALPVYFDSIRKSRRSDAITAMAQTQQAEERWRANNATFSSNFGTGELNVDTSGATVTTYTTSAGYYALTLSDIAGSTYKILATAQGSQANDTNCKLMELRVSAGTIEYCSGSTSGSLSCTSSTNSQCWKR